jgi:hypothetical protein
MGLMFYSALHPSHAEGHTGFSLESFIDVREHVPTVDDSTMRAEFTGPVILKNELAYPVSAAEFRMLMNYFDIDVGPIDHCLLLEIMNRCFPSYRESIYPPLRLSTSLLQTSTYP